MFIKPKINTFVLIVFGIICVACESYRDPITNKETTVIKSTQEEIAIGKQVAAGIEKKYKVSKDPVINARVQRIGSKIAAVCDRKGLNYHFTVLDDKMVNAMATPGGYIYITTGLIDLADSDDEIACVLGHEVGHVVARHSIQQMQKSIGTNIVADLFFAITKAGSGVRQSAEMLKPFLDRRYSRYDEMDSDQLGMRYAKRAGYNPRGMITFLKKLGKYGKENPTRLGALFRTHPYSEKRVKHCETLYGNNNF